MNQLITRLRIILQSKYLVYCLLLISILVTIYRINNINYIEEEKQISGTIQDIKIQDDYKDLYVGNVLIHDYGNNNYEVGDYVSTLGTLKVPSNESNTHLFNYRKYLLSKGIKYETKANKITLINKGNIIYKIKNKLIKHIDNRSTTPYLKTFIIGDSSNIDDNVMTSYQNNGISHLFAVSGMHVSLLTTILCLLLDKIKKKSNILIFIFLIFYIFLTNYSPSIIRASLLYMGCVINKKYKFNIKNEYILLFILSFSLLYNPFYIYNAGFIFSYTISYSLLKYGSITNNYKNYFLKLFITSLISFMASIPIMINNYHSINLFTPLYNIVFVPLVSIIIFPFSLITFIIPILDPILIILIKLMERLSLILSSLDTSIILCHINIYIFVIYYLVIIFIFNQLKKKKYQYMVIIITMLFIHTNYNYINNTPYISFINVGQGDSILLVLPHNKGNILIDACDKVNSKKSIGNQVIIPYLKAKGIKKLDYIINTHGDMDHIGSIDNIITMFKVDNVILNSGSINNNERYLIKKLNKKKIKYYQYSENTLNINGYKLYFINDKDSSNENEDSLIIYTVINNHKILLMGDAGFESEEYITNKYNLSNIDILKVGHHGSKYSTSQTFIKIINPKYSIISVGENNKFGHPNKEVLDILSNSAIYRTDKNGDITFKLKNNKLQIETCGL